MRLGRVMEIFGVDYNALVERKLYIRMAEKQGARLDGWMLCYPSGRRELCLFDYVQEVQTEPVQADLFAGLI